MLDSPSIPWRGSDCIRQEQSFIEDKRATIGNLLYARAIDGTNSWYFHRIRTPNVPGTRPAAIHGGGGSSCSQNRLQSLHEMRRMVFNLHQRLWSQYHMLRWAVQYY